MSPPCPSKIADPFAPHVMTIYQEISQLQSELESNKPSDALQYAADFFLNKLKERETEKKPVFKSSFDSDPKDSVKPSFKSPFNSDPHGSDTSNPVFKSPFNSDPHGSDPSNNSEDTVPELPSTLPSKFNINRRISVSAEALNPDKFKLDSWSPPTNDLSPDQRKALASSLSTNFLFKQLDDASKKTVISALQKKTFNKGDNIITQGDQGDFFYIIESGNVDYIVNSNHSGSSSVGSSFGELALMYNSPRAATVVASSEVVTWALDRSTFRRILLEGTFNRRLMYEDFLKDIPVLSVLSTSERSKIADALSTKIYKKGDIIVKEGEKGENFYFIELGNCKVFNEKVGDLGNLSKGDYFGEIALLNDLPRQATVEALDQVIVATLGKSGFERLLGPALQVLKSQDPRKD